MKLRSSGQVRSGARDSNINVEIRDSGLGEPVDMLLNPLGRTNETPFLGIPGSKDNVSLGLPARILELLEGSSELDKDSRSGVGISVATLKWSVVNV
jgi:hypothetical protein